MPTFEVLLVHESSVHYYVQADNEEDAVDKGVRLFENGESDENPACGWSKITSSTAKPIKGRR